MAKELSKKILVVDDEANILELYSEVLKDAGFDVHTASNGNEALQKCVEESYDLILLDIMMNEGPDGLECLKLIKAAPEKYKKPIIVMLTNLALTNNVKEAFDNGAEGYLIKLTLSNDQLVKKVKGFLHGFGDA
jgi:two-component system, OmpR family, alkaline phosphatase synthesis response regulator PhoP